MKKITRPCKPNVEKLIFSEGIDYFESGNKSVWGNGDKETLELLKNSDIKGLWLNLAAGDGRYNEFLLENASVIACDIDGSALAKLLHNTVKREKLNLCIFNIAGQFPFKDKSIDGIFCTGFLHFVPPDALKKIIKEITRVLRPEGRIILDFATDIKRVMPDGELYWKESTHTYKKEEANRLLIKLLKDFDFEIQMSEVPEEEVRTPVLRYKFSCNFLLVKGTKK